MGRSGPCAPADDIQRAPLAAPVAVFGSRYLRVIVGGALDYESAARLAEGLRGLPGEGAVREPATFSSSTETHTETQAPCQPATPL